MYLLKLEKLDTDLKNYKTNSIKESIRRGHDDLGDHYLDIGDLNNALKCYIRARDYCTSGKHLIHMCLNVIKVRVSIIAMLENSFRRFFILSDACNINSHQFYWGRLLWRFLFNPFNRIWDMDWSILLPWVDFMFSLLFQVSVYLQNWSNVLSYVSKAEATPDLVEAKKVYLHWYFLYF